MREKVVTPKLLLMCQECQPPVYLINLDSDKEQARCAVALAAIVSLLECVLLILKSLRDYPAPSQIRRPVQHLQGPIDANFYYA